MGDEQVQAEPWTWHLFVPFLSEKQALKLVRLAVGEGIDGAAAMNPAFNFSLGLDRWTAQWLRAALSDGPSLVPGHRPSEFKSVTPAEARKEIEPLIADLDDWIAQSRHDPEAF